MAPNYMKRPSSPSAEQQQQDLPASATLPFGFRSRPALKTFHTPSFGHGASSGVLQTPSQSPAPLTHNPQAKRWLVFVKPCEAFLGHVEAQERCLSANLKQGLLAPLQPSLAGQLAVIAKDFGFPTPSGLSLWLNASFGQPKVNEDVWSFRMFFKSASACALLSADSFILPTVWQDPTPVDGFNLPIAGSLLLDVDVLVGWLPVWLAAQEAPAATMQSGARFDNNNTRSAARRRLTLMGSLSVNNMKEYLERTAAAEEDEEDERVHGAREVRAASVSSTNTAVSVTPAPEQLEFINKRQAITQDAFPMAETTQDVSGALCSFTSSLDCARFAFCSDLTLTVEHIHIEEVQRAHPVEVPAITDWLTL